MRIIYFHQYFNTPEMNGGTRSYEFASRLSRRGHIVNLITLNPKSNDKFKWVTTIEKDGVVVHWLGLPYSNHMHYVRRIFIFLIYAFMATFKANKIQADLIFATSTPLTVAIPAILISKFHKLPMVFEVRDLWPEIPIAIGALKNPFLKFIAKSLERFSYKNSKFVIGLSPGMVDGIIKAGYPSKNIALIPNGCDFNIFSPIYAKPYDYPYFPLIKNKSHLVVYTGTLGRINGVSYLVEIAFMALKINPSINFLVIGNGYDEIKIRQLASELGILNVNFQIHPPCSKIDIANVLSMASLSLSLFIGIKEMESNSANKFFDALASRTPIAINYGGWQADLIKKFNIGIVIPNEKPSVAAKIICDFLDNKVLVRNASESAYLLAKNKFCRDVLADDFERVLLSVLHNSNHE